MPNKGGKHTDEAKRRIGEATRASMTPERRAFYSQLATGRKYDEATRKDMSEKKKAWWAEQKAKHPQRYK